MWSPCRWSYSVIHSILTPPYIFPQNTPSKLSLYWGITFTGKRTINLQTYHYFCQRNIELNRQSCFLLSAWIFILPEQSVELRFLISGKIYFLIGERRSGHRIWEEIWRNEKKHLLERGLHPGKHNDTQVRLHCHSDGLLIGSKCHCTQKDQLNTNTNTLF